MQMTVDKGEEKKMCVHLGHCLEVVKAEHSCFTDKDLKLHRFIFRTWKNCFANK